MIAVMIRVLVLVFAVGCLSACSPLAIVSGLHSFACDDLECGISIPKPRPVCAPGVDRKAVTWCRVVGGTDGSAR
jgi:hypothetical protein